MRWQLSVLVCGTLNVLTTSYYPLLKMQQVLFGVLCYLCILIPRECKKPQKIQPSVFGLRDLNFCKDGVFIQHVLLGSKCFSSLFGPSVTVDLSCP